MHERQAELFDLLVGQRPVVHPPERLALHQLAQQLDQRQHELRETLLDLLWIRGDAPGECVLDPIETLRREREVAAARENTIGGHAGPSTKLNGAQGPVQTTVTSSCAAAKRSTARQTCSTLCRSTRYAADSPSSRESRASSCNS